MSGIIKLLIAALLGCAYALVIVFVFSGHHHDPAEETKASLKRIMSAIEEFRKDTGNYPSESGWIGELKANAKSRRLIETLSESAWSAENPDEFRDMWGAAIKYFPRGAMAETPELKSAGPDGDMTTEEDNVRRTR